MKHPEKIAVLGGTGKAGQYLIKQLLSQGYTVKALARNPEKIEQAGPLIEVLQGNARDYESVHNLLSGCDAVISTLGPSGKDTDTCSMAVGHIIKTMHELKIPRYIEVSGLGIDTPGDNKGFQTRLIVSILKWFFPAVIEDRQKCYRMLEESSIQWTIVRCPMIKLTDSASHIKTSLLDSPGRKISAGGLAEFLVNQLNQDQFVRKAPFISN
jgi:putative NADH-flavin reductase